MWASPVMSPDPATVALCCKPGSRPCWSSDDECLSQSNAATNEKTLLCVGTEYARYIRVTKQAIVDDEAKTWLINSKVVWR